LQKRRALRTGRPPRELAGEVDARILDAARRLFLDRGLAGASIEEIAELACAGKPTIYARYPGKEALFSAVVMRNVATNIARFENYVPAGATVEQRLASVGSAVLHWILVGDTVGLMRMISWSCRCSFERCMERNSRDRAACGTQCCFLSCACQHGWGQLSLTFDLEGTRSPSQSTMASL
jgi:AcrR family transcriptional regulator